MELIFRLHGHGKSLLQVFLSAPGIRDRCSFKFIKMHAHTISAVRDPKHNCMKVDASIGRTTVGRTFCGALCISAVRASKG
jgi:hypothetical protein